MTLNHNALKLQKELHGGRGPTVGEKTSTI